jgi:hypothetical protein
MGAFMRNGALWIVGLVLSLAETRAFASVIRDPVIKITEISASGPGCPEGTAADNISSDGLAFTQAYDSFSIDVDSARTTQRSAICDIKLHVSAPAGWSYALVGFDVRGFAALDVWGYAYFQTYFKLRNSFVPAGIKYVPRNTNGDVLVRSRSTLILNNMRTCEPVESDVIIRIKVTARGRRAAAGVDSIDGELSKHLHIEKSSCAH